jgi:hypothetical protein
MSISVFGSENDKFHKRKAIRWSKQAADCGYCDTRNSRIAIGQVLVDTGADFVQVPFSLLLAAGVSLNGASKINVVTAGGTVRMAFVPQVSYWSKVVHLS